MLQDVNIGATQSRWHKPVGLVYATAPV